jgi:hypothetical protein
MNEHSYLANFDWITYFWHVGAFMLCFASVVGVRHLLLWAVWRKS